MLTLLHISDLHFGPPYVTRVGEALLSVASSLNADAIVASGDFTQRAKEDQFASAKDFLQRLPEVPKIVVPGNHDVPLYRVVERISDPYRHYRSFISEKLDDVWQLDGAVIVALNSTAPRRAVTNGRIRLRQLEFCRRAFENTDDGTAKIVVAHHHFAPAPDYERDKTLPGAKRAMDHFLGMGVDLILGGHLHRAYIGNSLDVYSGAERERGIIIVQCGTTTSRRGRGREKEKNSFNVIEIDEGTIRVTHHMFFDDTGGFQPISRHLFPRPGNRLAESPEFNTE